MTDLKLKGFTGEYFNGHPVFIREDYERVNGNLDERERISIQLGGTMYSTLLGAKVDAEYKDRSLLYRNKDFMFDSQLRHFAPLEAMWHMYEGGYVHEITGELVKSCYRPDYDSNPAWSKRYQDRSMLGSGYGQTTADVTNTVIFGAAFLLALATEWAQRKT